MTYSIKENGDLLITIDEDERQELQEMKDSDPDSFGSDYVLGDVFESLIANSPLDWIRPEVCGDLTDAPILGIWNYEENTVTDRWGYMDYALRSPQDDLLSKGYCIFQAP